MGNKYIEQNCSNCNDDTFHRVFKRYGKAGRDGKKSLRRIVTWCLNCQKRKIDNSRNRRE